MRFITTIVSYTRLNANIFRGLSVTNIVLWVICTSLTTAILVRYANLGAGIQGDSVGDLDFVFAGLWSSFFYGIGGLIGLCASYERKRTQIIPMAVFCLLGVFGAIVTAGISGHIAVYIMQNRDDVNNTICHPEVLYPPIFTDEQAEEDCLAWAILEYVLMGYSIAAGVINILVLLLIAVAVSGPKVHGDVV